MLQAQQDLSIQGVVLDRITQAPLPFAHIGMPSLGIGTTTNEQGRFIFNFYTSKKEFDRIKWKAVEKKDISAYDIIRPYNEAFWKTFNILQLEPLQKKVRDDLEWASSLEAQFRKNGQKK